MPCSKCGKSGHYASTCVARKRKQVEKNAESQDDDRQGAAITLVNYPKDLCCCICLMPYTRQTMPVIMCSYSDHLLCGECAKDTTKLQSRCPECRQDLLPTAIRASKFHVHILICMSLNVSLSLHCRFRDVLFRRESEAQFLSLSSRLRC